MDLNSVTGFLSSPILKVFIVMFQIFVFVFWFALVAWTYRDANQRGASGLYWGAVTFFFNVFGLFIYLMLRPAEFLDDVKERELEIKTKQAALRGSMLNCPACHKPVDKDFLICPYCRKKLKNACTNCQKPLSLSWTICPYCKTNV